MCVSVCVFAFAACHNCHNFYLVTAAAAVAMATKAACLRQTTFV